MIGTPGERLQQLFDSALSLSPVEREALLTRRAEEDSELVAQVRQLLEAHQANQDTSFLATAAAELRREGAELPAGRRIGNYVIRRLLGMGGMGAVYLADRAEDYRQKAAIKVLRAGQASEAAIRRFLNERQLLADLQHPNVVRLLDSGTTEDGLPYLVLEYVEGEPLDRFCEMAQAPLRRRLELLVQVSRTVAYAHERGVIHRDLKPSNVLVDGGGQPHLLDLGIARQLGGGDHQTATGETWGTPSYLAPEQVAGAGRDADPRTDVYGLGSVLYELLTGRPPFRGATSLETLDQVRKQDPIPPSALVTGLPRDVETICLKCLRKDPAARYASASDLADDVERHLQGKPILARPVGRLEKARLWVRRNPTLSAALVLAVACVVLGLQAERWRVARQRARADLTAQEANEAMLRGDWNAAISLLQTALDQGPTDPVRLKLELVRAHKARGDLAEGRRLLAELSASGPHGGRIRVWRGDDLIWSGKREEGLKQIDAALEMNLVPADRAYAQALRASTIPEALAALRKAVELDALHKDAQSQYVFLLLLTGRVEEARRWGEVGQTRFPKDPAFAILLALLDARDGKIAEASRRLDAHAETLNPRYRQVLDEALIVLDELRGLMDRIAGAKQPDLAVLVRLQKSVQQIQDFSGAGFELRLAPNWRPLPAAKDEAQDGFRCYVRALALLPDAPPVDREALRKGEQLALEASATPSLVPNVKQHALSLAVNFCIAWAAHAGDQDAVTRALRYVDEAKKLGTFPVCQPNLNLVALLWVHRVKAPGIHRRIVEDQLRQNPDHPAVLEERVRAAWWDGDHSTALRDADTILAKQPAKPQVRFYRTEAVLGLYRQLGEKGAPPPTVALRALGGSTSKVPQRIEQLTQGNPEPQQYVYAAQVAVIASLASPEEAVKLRRRAMDLLEAARKAGWFGSPSNRAIYHRSVAFTALDGDPEYQQWLKRLAPK